jgi:hypothetical protein
MVCKYPKCGPFVTSKGKEGSCEYNGGPSSPANPIGGLSRRWDADSVSAAGADWTAGDRVERFVEADFYGGEEVVAATDSDAVAGQLGVGTGEERDDFVGWHQGLRGKTGQSWRNGDGAVGRARRLEEIVRAQAGTGAVGAPFMLKESLVGIDVAEGGWIGGAGSFGAIFGISAVDILRPEAMEDEGGVRGALGGAGMRVAELGRPGEVEQVVVESRALSEARNCAVWSCRWARRRGVGVGGGFAGAEQDEKRDRSSQGRELHAAQDSRCATKVAVSHVSEARRGAPMVVHYRGIG